MHTQSRETQIKCGTKPATPAKLSQLMTQNPPTARSDTASCQTERYSTVQHSDKKRTHTTQQAQRSSPPKCNNSCRTFSLSHGLRLASIEYPLRQSAACAPNTSFLINRYPDRGGLSPHMNAATPQHLFFRRFLPYSRLESPLSSAVLPLHSMTFKICRISIRKQKGFFLIKNRPRFNRGLLKFGLSQGFCSGKGEKHQTFTSLCMHITWF